MVAQALCERMEGQVSRANKGWCCDIIFYWVVFWSFEQMLATGHWASHSIRKMLHEYIDETYTYTHNRTHTHTSRTHRTHTQIHTFIHYIYIWALKEGLKWWPKLNTCGAMARVPGSKPFSSLTLQKFCGPARWSTTRCSPALKSRLSEKMTRECFLVLHPSNSWIL